MARVRIGTFGHPAVPLTATVTGPGAYRAVVRVAPRWKDNDVVDIPFRSPARALHGRFCLRNGGRRAAALYGADDRSHTISVTTVDGRQVGPNFDLAFVEGDRGTMGGTLPVMGNLSVFRPLVGPWCLWPLAVLVVAGLPLGLVWTLRRAVDDD